MNCSKTSRSAWSQSLKAESSRHPPKHQSSRARRSICCCASRCSPTVKATRSTIKPGDGFLIWGSSVRRQGLAGRVWESVRWIGLFTTKSMGLSVASFAVCRCSLREQLAPQRLSGRWLLGNADEHVRATNGIQPVEHRRVGPICKGIGNIGKIGDIQPRAA